MVEVYEVTTDALAGLALPDYSPASSSGFWLLVKRYRDGGFENEPLLVNRCRSYGSALLAQKMDLAKDVRTLAWLMQNYGEWQYVPADYEIWHELTGNEDLDALDQLFQAGEIDLQPMHETEHGDEGKRHNWHLMVKFPEV